jgi:hypothetical protein
VANCHDEDQEYVVVDLVDDAVVAGADPPFAVSAHTLLRAAGPWLFGEELDRCLDPSPRRGVEPSELPHRGRGDFDA